MTVARYNLLLRTKYFLLFFRSKTIFTTVEFGPLVIIKNIRIDIDKGRIIIV